MIQLSYQPALDPLHGIFRFLRISKHLKLSHVDFDKLRILDYYLLFPFRAAAIKFKQNDIHLRSVAKQLNEKQGYAALPSGEILFDRMKSVHVSAAQTMAERNAIDSVALRNGKIKFRSLDLPKEFDDRILTANKEDEKTMLILEALSNYELFGKDGLKDRTSLLEFRYDNI